MLKFKKEYEDAEIHIPAKRIVINRYNIHDETIQKVLLKYPKYAHNFEEVEGEDGSKSVQESTMLEGEGADMMLSNPTKSSAIVGTEKGDSNLSSAPKKKPTTAKAPTKKSGGSKKK